MADSPDAFRRRLYRADVVLAFAEDVDERFAVQTQLHRSAQHRIVKRRRIGDEQIRPAVHRLDFASLAAPDFVPA